MDRDRGDRRRRRTARTSTSGINAIDRLRTALDRVKDLEDLPVPGAARRHAGDRQTRSRSPSRFRAPAKSETLQRVTVNIGTIEGGTSPNLVPTHCIARADIRLPVGITTDVLAAKLDEWLAPARRRDAGGRMRRFEPYFTRPGDEIVVRTARRRGRSAGHRAGGEHARRRLGLALVPPAGVPTVVLGLTPFNMGGPDEYVLVDELLAVAKIHTLAAFDFLTTAPDTGGRHCRRRAVHLPLTFMGAPYGRPGPSNKAAILGIPFDCGTNMRIGARGGPDSVRQQSPLMRRFNPTHADFDPVAALGARRLRQRQADAGQDRRCVRAHRAGGRPHRRRPAPCPITIGGDGSVTVPVDARGRQEVQEDGGAAHRLPHRCLSLRPR